MARLPLIVSGVEFSFQPLNESRGGEPTALFDKGKEMAVAGALHQQFSELFVQFLFDEIGHER